MSRNHENVIWQSKDKTWSVGLFYKERLYSNDAYEAEDDEYDYAKFEFASVGHATEDSAMRSYPGPNTGGGTVISYTKQNAKATADYDRMAQFFLKPELAAAAEKKAIAKAKREHSKKLKADFTKNNDYKGYDVTVVIKRDTQTYTVIGISTSHTGYARTEGDWLMVNKVKVKNLTTGRINPKLHEIRITPQLSSYGRSYGY